ncbi:hypothetical protein I551_2719 [Mycobacterium ulcerans str. Harvey]|uniref:Uncharacterized protein n=1 Tax=Mycobacterium ulcerans str. Harvey TaxID=1299332 RepID=A0ABN0R1S6_MYCUL|nr:hypothetical protein I551_2719 [Mycobacterium ulcerans str. Harvey]
MAATADVATAAAAPPTRAGMRRSDPITSLRDSTVIAVVCRPMTEAGIRARR